ncbi:MAG: hypothetical protein WA510_25090, partial [Acidobacteriaceae bacterium]
VQLKQVFRIAGWKLSDLLATKLSSRPKRSEVERSAVRFPAHKGQCNHAFAFRLETRGFPNNRIVISTEVERSAVILPPHNYLTERKDIADGNNS